MRILVTRPKEDSTSLVSALGEMGVDSLVEPLLTIKHQNPKTLSLEGVQALLITSANGVRAFAEFEKSRDLPVYTVGDASKREAEAVGFKKVFSAAGDVETLAQLVTDKLQPHKGTLLHVAGSKVAGDLKGLLEKNEFYYRRVVLYSAEKSDGLSKEVKKSIRDGNLQGVVFYSPRTAEAFVALAKKARLGKACKNLTAYCLSEAVAEKARVISWKILEIADKPEQESLLKKIQQAVKPGAADPTLDNESIEPVMKTPEKTDSQKETSKSEAQKKDSKVKDTSKVIEAKVDGKDALAKDKEASKPVGKEANPEDKTPPPPPVPEKSKGSGIGGFMIFLVVVIVIGAGAFASAPIWTPKVAAYLPQQVLDVLGLAPQSAPAKQSADKKEAPSTEALVAERDRIQPELDRLLKRVETLETALNDVKDMMAAVSSPNAPGGSVDALNEVTERIAKLEQQGISASGGSGNYEALSDRIKKLEEEKQSAAPDLQPTLDSLTRRLKDLEAVKEKAAQSVASAPGMILAVGQLRESLHMERPFVKELETLKALTGEDGQANEAISVLSPLAPAGVKSLTSLRAAFDNQAANIVRASVTPDGKNWMEQTVNQLASVVSVRRTGENVKGDTADAIVARTEALLRAGDLAAAVKEVKTLKGKPATTAEGWVAVAEQRLEADKALNALYARAIALVAASN